MHKGRRACAARFIATELLGLDQQSTQTAAKRASIAASRVWDLVAWAILVHRLSTFKRSQIPG